MRAADQLRAPSDRILDDPYAEGFLTRPWRAALAALRRTGRLGDRALDASPGVTTFVLARHRFIDDALAAAIVDPGIEQLVLLGAGYDSRAYRFASDLRDVTVFEVDHPATAARKAAVVAKHASGLPRAGIVRVPVDFETQSLEERLVDAGFRRGARTFWAWEGVSMYLQRPAVQGTLATIRALSGPGSRLSMDFWYLVDEATWRGTLWRTTPGLLHLVGEPITFSMHPADARAFLAGQGLETLDLADADELGRRYVRDDRAVLPGMFVVTARTATQSTNSDPR
jgi:methyltransferase (TIGR00027 family)